MNVHWSKRQSDEWDGGGGCQKEQKRKKSKIKKKREQQSQLTDYRGMQKKKRVSPLGKWLGFRRERKRGPLSTVTSVFWSSSAATPRSKVKTEQTDESLSESWTRQHTCRRYLTQTKPSSQRKHESRSVYIWTSSTHTDAHLCTHKRTRTDAGRKYNLF